MLRTDSETSSGGGMLQDQELDPALLLEAFNVLEEAVVIYGPDGRLIYCNAQFRAFYNYTPDEARPGVHFRELGQIDIKKGNVVVGDEVGGGEAYLERKAEYRRTLKGSFIVHLKDGRWIKTTDRRLPNGGFVSIQTDITDLKNAEKNLQERNASLEAASRAKTMFLATMSHELRTPLNAVIGFSDLIREEVMGPVGNEKYSSYIADIHASGRVLLDLVNNVLDYSKMESEAYQFDLKPVPLAGVVTDSIRLLRPIAAVRGIELVQHSDLADVRVLADARALHQVLTNLLSNAVKFSNPGASVDVKADVDESGGLVRLTLQDHGRGMTEEELSRIGEPFVQVHNSYISDMKGTGLGLAICHKLANGMNLDLSISSSFGEGTKVTLILPLA